MKSKVILLSSLFAAFTLALLAAQNHTPPPQRVQDWSEQLSTSTQKALSQAFQEHFETTKTQIHLQIFDSLTQQDVISETLKHYRGKDPADSPQLDAKVLIAFYRENKKAWIISGIRNETLLSEIKIRNLIFNEIIPTLEQSGVENAAILASQRVLETTGSPLIESGRLDEIFLKQGIEFVAVSPPQPRHSMGGALSIALGVFLLAVPLFFSAIFPDFHYTRAGIVKVNRLKQCLKNILSKSSQSRGEPEGYYGHW